MTVPVEAGQWRRRGRGMVVWAVLKPHPRRKGFWLVTSHEFPYPVESFGRRELEGMDVVSVDYFGARGHPGARYCAPFMEMGA